MDGVRQEFRAAHAAPMLTCSPCHRLIPVVNGNPVAEFIRGEGAICPGCGKQVDVWTSIWEHLATWEQIGTMPIGTRHTLIPFEVPRNGATTINLGEYEIPAEARILERTYCGQDFSRIVPLEIHGQRPALGPVWNGQLRIFGAEYLQAEENPERSRQLLSITWVPPSLDAEGWSSLWSALEAFARHDHQGVVVPANTAVELTLDRVLASFLESVPLVSSANRKAFLGDVSYGHRLNVILPALLRFTDAPTMWPELREDLNTLKTLRNQVGHTGTTKEPISRTLAAKMIRASIFGFHYLHVIDPFLRSDGARTGAANAGPAQRPELPDRESSADG